MTASRHDAFSPIAPCAKRSRYAVPPAEKNVAPFKGFPGCQLSSGLMAWSLRAAAGGAAAVTAQHSGDEAINESLTLMALRRQEAWMILDG